MLAEDPLAELTESKQLRVHVIRPQLTENAAKTVVCYGKFRPVRESRLQFGRPGVVEKLLKSVGETVLEGELIAELQQDDLNNQTSKLESTLQDAQDKIKTMPAAEASKQKSRIQQLQAQLKTLQVQLAAGRLTADAAGVVVKSDLKVAAMAFPGRTTLTVADKQSPFVDISLNSDTAAELADNQSVWVGHNGTALVTSIKSRESISTEAGGERLTLEFRKPLDSDSWSYGSVVEVRYRRFEGESGYWIPMTALKRSTDGSWSVLIAEPLKNDAALSLVRKQSCEVVRHQNDQILVNALNLDQAAVIVDGTHRIVPGQNVVLVEVTTDDSGTFRPDQSR